MTLANEPQPVEQLPPKALARKIVDAAVAKAEAEEDEDMRDYIHCQIGKVGDLDVVAAHNEMDGARVELWNSRDSWKSYPDFYLNPDEISALIQALTVAKFAMKMLDREHGPGWGPEVFSKEEAPEVKPAL